MNNFRQSLREQMHRSIQLTRQEIWKGEAVYQPSVRVAFAAYPRVGFVGNSYQPGGIVLVGSRGNSTEGQDAERIQRLYQSVEAGKYNT